MILKRKPFFKLYKCANCFNVREEIILKRKLFKDKKGKSKFMWCKQCEFVSKHWKLDKENFAVR